MKKTYFFLFFYFIVKFCSAQGPLPTIQNISVVSPEVASIGKYGNIPVGYSTGIPEISVSIFEIKAGFIKLPISLSYHGGGIRVDEVASSAGLGWTLNAGGAISRNMIGKADESGGGYLTTPSDEVLLDNPEPYYRFLYNTNQSSDFEPDIFSFNVNGQSGKFIFNKDGSVFQIPLSDYKIEFIRLDDTFKITDNQGIIYYYQSEEVQLAQVAPVRAYTSAWRLTKIEDPLHNETIKFSYQKTTEEGEVIHDDIASFTCTPNSNSTVGSFTVINNNSSRQSTQIRHITSLYLSDIIWSGGKIHFTNSSDRTDRTGGLRLQSIQIYTDNNGNYKQLKEIGLSHSYFFNNDTSSEYFPYNNSDSRNYRLKLDTVTFLAANSSNVDQKYVMIYDQTPMASRESSAQDMWGFNNGAFSNRSLLGVQQAFNYLGNSFTIGNANRDPNSSNIKAGMLQSIQYPTGGKSVFEFEPHSYQDPFTLSHKSRMCSVNSSGGTKSNSMNFTYNGVLNLTLNYGISKYDFNTQIPEPSITIVDQTTNTSMVIKNPDRLRDFQIRTINDGTNNLTFINGHSYMITVDINANTLTNGQLSAFFELNWDDRVGDPVYRTGGGLRVKTITNYDNTGVFVSKDAYRYGTTAEEGYGLLMTNPALTKVNRSSVFNRVRINPGLGGNFYNDAPVSYVYHSNTLASISMVSGSPVLYPVVTKYSTNADESQNNGKIIYTYNVINDVTVSLHPFEEYVITNDWQNNFMTSETYFKKSGISYLPVHKKEYHYQLERQVYKHQLKILKNFTFNGPNGELQEPSKILAFNSNRQPLADFRFLPYERLSGAMLLYQITSTNWENDHMQVLKEKYSYDHAFNLLLTEKAVTNSNGEVLSTRYKYPHDFATTSPYTEMVNNFHIWSPVVEELNYKIKVANQITQETFLSSTKTDYQSWNGVNALIAPLKVSTKTGNISNVYEPRVKYDAYSNNGKPITVSQAFGANVGYQWGYNAQYPVALAINAQNKILTSTEPVTASNTVAVSSGNSITFTTASVGSVTLSLRLTSPPTRSFSVTFALQGIITDTFCFQPAGGSMVCGSFGHSTLTIPNLPAGSYTLKINSIFDTSPNNPSPLYATIDFSYPSSQVITTGVRDFFYESFEEGEGNSTFDDARTGHLSYQGKYSKELNGLLARSYVLSYWKKTANGWVLHEQQPITVTGGTYTIIIPSGQIDDVRFYPVDAQMTTYTYDPLVGMTSMTDAKGMVTIYEYDSFQRLKSVKDQHGNIIKDNTYHYKN